MLMIFHGFLFLLHYCTRVILYYCTTVLLYDCTFVLLYYCIIVPLYYCDSALLHYCTFVLLYYCNIVHGTMGNETTGDETMRNETMGNDGKSWETTGKAPCIKNVHFDKKSQETIGNHGRSHLKSPYPLSIF